MLSWSWITDNMATGARINQSSDIDRLAAGGVTHVLNLCTLEDFDTLHELRIQALQAQFDDVKEPLAFPFQYLWNPAADDGQPKPSSWFEASGTFALPAMAVGGKVYVHCKVGFNRGPSTCYFLLRCLGWSANAAWWRVHLKRPVTFLGGMRYWPDAERSLKDLGLA